MLSRLCNLGLLFTYPFIPYFCIPLFHATMTENVISPQIGTITAVKRLLYVLRQCEKIMSPISFNMMKKALFSVFQKSWIL
mgnify:FL=1